VTGRAPDPAGPPLSPDAAAVLDGAPADTKRWAVVLGASSGLGAATARAFARAGWPVVGVHLDLRSTLERAHAVEADVRAAGVDCWMVNRNAADARCREAVVEGLRSRGGRVGALVHSLAFGSLRPFVGEPESRTQERHLTMTMDVMAHSLVWWVNALLDAGQLDRGARVFAMTSAGSQVAFPAYGAVSAAKSALESHVRQLAVELAPRQITVNALMAGLTRTPALEAIPGWQALEAAARARHPSGRLTTPEDVAACLLALCVPGTAWVTGNVIRVDGGEAISA
jgi:NAD(P)-dependent dehydrogenase (short-subunit alcohol dehydrogenase family)